MSVNYKSCNVLVTGGAGFVGSNLIKRLLTLGCKDITSLDDYSSGRSENHHPDVTYIEGSTLDIIDHVKKDYDYIFHFGEYSRVEQSYNNIDQVIKSNTLGTAAVIAYWMKTNAKLIYSGSSTKFIVGESEKEQSPYSITKKKNTELIFELGSLLNQDFAIVYFYNVYGENENSSDDYGTLISKYIKLMRAKKPLTVVRPGTQRRNFTHINDTVDGILLVAEDGYGDDYGIGADQSYTILEVANLFNTQIDLIPERLGNRASAEVKNEKVKTLGWKQKHYLKDYVQQEMGKLKSVE
ncbi:NAD-dependent epimerase/dehydratase family protein [Amylibacter sp.]|nr:NAD-dependent epimerase/dehydratase family protein [Amylibacter sp.]